MIVRAADVGGTGEAATTIIVRVALAVSTGELESVAVTPKV